VRYGNVSESERIKSEFYAKELPGKPSVLANYSVSDCPVAVIVTYGKIVEEALAAADELKENGINTGVVLLEYLKPYDKTTEEIKKLIAPGVKTVVFLEEGIKNGGAAMLLRDKLLAANDFKNVRMNILAIDDSFVHLKKGEVPYSAAGISAAHIKKAITNDLSPK
jgi:deoxyxylulose-5-phosphate synthase